MAQLLQQAQQLQQQLVAQHAAESSGAGPDDTPVVDPEQAALQLLKATLGARPIEG